MLSPIAFENEKNNLQISKNIQYYNYYINKIVPICHGDVWNLKFLGDTYVSILT